MSAAARNDERAAMRELLTSLITDDAQLHAVGFELVTIFLRGKDRYALRPYVDHGDGWKPAAPGSCVAQALIAFGNERLMNVSLLYGMRATAHGVELLEPLVGRCDDAEFAGLPTQIP